MMASTGSTPSGRSGNNSAAASAAAAAGGDRAALVDAIRDLETDPRDPLVSADQPCAVYILKPEFIAYKRTGAGRQVSDDIRAAVRQIDAIDGRNLRGRKGYSAIIGGHRCCVLGLVQAVLQ